MTRTKDNVITGGSEVSGVNYVTAKKKSHHVVNLDLRKTYQDISRPAQIISFSSSKSHYPNNLHDNTLVISLGISYLLTKLILVENGIFETFSFRMQIGKWRSRSQASPEKRSLTGI